MALITLLEEETALTGVLQADLSTTGTSFTAIFYDTKTGLQRTPQSTTLTFLLSKDTSAAERVRASSHTTNGTTGVTTVTIASNGRALPMYGVGSGSSTGNFHPSGDPVGCVTNHEAVSQINSFISGSKGSGYNSIRIGDETDSNITIYAQNADANKPYLRYDAASNSWVFSNDGTSSTAIGSGASVYTGGDGITITASDIDIDLTDTVIFVQTSSGAGDAGKVPRLSAGTGKLATGFITAAPFTTYISDSAALVGGATSNADALHTHSGLTTSITAGEAIDGSTVAKPIALTGNNFKGVIIAPGNGFIIMNNTAGTTRAVGDVDARAKRGQSFTITDSLATSITLESITIMLEVAGSPADYCTLEISEDSGGFPSSTIITNGTATPIQGSSLTNDARPQKFTFATPPTLTSGTTYWFALRRSTVGGGASALDAANYYSMFDAGANVVTGDSAVYTASTLTWGSSTTTDFQFVLQYNRDYDAKALITDGDSLTRTRFKGFTRSNVAGGDSIALATSGSISGLTLTAGTDYYLDTTQGALTATAPSPTTTFNGLVPVIRVGTAANSTDLIIDPSFEALLVTSFSNGGLTQAGLQPDANLDVFIETGFTPREFELRYEINNVAGTGTDDRFIVSKYIRTTQASVFQMTTSGFATFAGISSTASTYLSIQAIYENGFLLRIFTTDTSETLTNVQIFIKS